MAGQLDLFQAQDCEADDALIVVGAVEQHAGDQRDGQHDARDRRGSPTEASAATIWRWLHDDAIKPWQTRSWIFPRDPDFPLKAGRAPDLYARVFEGKRLRPDEYVICADEKSQLQALGSPP